MIPYYSNLDVRTYRFLNFYYLFFTKVNPEIDVDEVNPEMDVDEAEEVTVTKKKKTAAVPR